MALSIDDVLKILKIVEESDCEEFELEFEGTKLVVRRTAGATPALSASVVAASPDARAAAPGLDAKPGVEATAGREIDAVPPGQHGIRAPMVGTFYRAPAPGAPPFVEVGSVVTENNVVGILEVMKLMNSIAAGARGRVARICAQNGAFVEYDQLLMLIQPLDPTDPKPGASPC